MIIYFLVGTFISFFYYVSVLKRNEIIAFTIYSFYLVFYLVPFVYYIFDIEFYPAISKQYAMLITISLANLICFHLLYITSKKFDLNDFRNIAVSGGLGIFLSKKNAAFIAILIVVFFGIDSLVFTEIISANISRGELRLETYEDSMNEGSAKFIKIFIRTVFYVSIASLFIKDYKKLSVFLFLIVFLLDVLVVIKTSTHRSPLIFSLIFLFFIYILFFKRVKYFTLYMILGTLILPIYFSMAALYRAGLDVELADSYKSVFVHGFDGLYTLSEVPVLKKELDRGRLDYEYGLQIIYTALTPIPRLIWSEKPNVSFSSRKTIEIYGAIKPGNWIRTFTVYGEGYSQFSYLGILIYAVIFSSMIYFIFFIMFNYTAFSLSFLKMFSMMPFLVRADLFSFFGVLYPTFILFALLLFLQKTILKKLSK